MMRNDYLLLSRLLHKHVSKIKSEDEAQSPCKTAKSALLMEIVTDLADTLEAESTKFRRGLFFDKIFSAEQKCEGTEKSNGYEK